MSRETDACFKIYDIIHKLQKIRDVYGNGFLACRMKLNLMYSEIILLILFKEVFVGDNPMHVV